MIMKVDTNLVPFQETWRDNLGGMANAIFWLRDNWKSDLNAQGDFIHPDGTRSPWNYAPLNQVLMWVGFKDGSGVKETHVEGVFLPVSRSVLMFEVDISKMIVINGADRDNATIYRPFAKDAAPLEIEWLVTRRVVIESQQHFERCPTCLVTAVEKLEKLIKSKPCTNLKDVKLWNLLPPVNLIPKTLQVNEDVLKGYQRLARLLVDLNENIAVWSDPMIYQKLVIAFHRFYLQVEYCAADAGASTAAQSMPLEGFPAIVGQYLAATLKQELVDIRNNDTHRNLNAAITFIGTRHLETMIEVAETALSQSPPTG